MNTTGSRSIVHQASTRKVISLVCYGLFAGIVVGCTGVVDSSPRQSSIKLARGVPALVVRSSAFHSGDLCPDEFTSDGIGVSPPVEWSGAPAETKSFAINLYRVNVDKNADSSWTSSYWVLYNIPADISQLKKGEKEVGVEGLNDRSKRGYDPLNAKQRGDNEYHLTVYALSKILEFDTDKIARRAMLDAVEDVKLAQGTLDFRYEHARKAHSR